MLDLMNQLFGEYGHVVRSPKLVRKSMLFEWEGYVYLDPSFEFMLRKPEAPHEPFLAFFAGFFDAEGCIIIKRQGESNTTNVSLEVANNNLPLLQLCRGRLSALGYHATIPCRPYHRQGEFVGLGRYNKDCWRLSISRRPEAIALLSSLNLQHRERVKKKALALRHHNSLWKDVAYDMQGFRMKLDREVEKSVAEAREAYLAQKKMSEDDLARWCSRPSILAFGAGDPGSNPGRATSHELRIPAFTGHGRKT